MKIAIDISQVVYTGTGVARYTKYLIEAVTKYDTTNEYIFFLSTLRGIVDKETQVLLKNQILKRSYLPPILLSYLWNTLHIVPVESFVGAVDLMITSDWTEPPTKNAKKMTVVHDLVYLKYPETVHETILRAQKERMKWVLKESDMILADSEATKQDIIELLNVEPTRINVVYPAIEIIMPSSNQVSDIRQKYSLYKPFILSVGKMEPRKNIPRLIEAFEKLGITNVDLVIVGPTGWGGEQISSKNYPNIKFLGFVPDADLYALYGQALCFVMPSLYEGFGYPLVEAMKCGCPVATSNVSSMKEIVGDAGILFDPLTISSITKALKQLIEDSKLRPALSQKGTLRAKYFELPRFAREVIGAFNHIT